MPQSVEKISVTVPTELLWSVKAEMKATGRNRSQVIAACIRAKLNPETTREEFDQLRADVNKLLRLAESTGAL